MNLTNEQQEEINSNFQTEFNKINKNSNARTFSTNDINFLKEMNKLYGNAMSAKGLNLIDPIAANFFHYNKMSMRGNTDYSRVTRTHVFFTRPELNFSYENINSIPFFQWLYSKRIGKMIMTALTDPNYFINAPSMLNTSGVDKKEILEIYAKLAQQKAEYDYKLAQAEHVKEFANWIQKTNSGVFDAAVTSQPTNPNIGGYQTAINERNKAMGLTGKINSSSISTSSAEKEEIESRFESDLESTINLDELTDSDAMQLFSTDFKQVKAVFNQFDNVYAQHIERINAYNNKIDKGSGQRLSDLGLKYAATWMNDEEGRTENFRYTTPFIPLLGNTCVSVDGAKDASMNTHTYEEDKFSSNMTVPTGFDEMWSSGSLSTSFEDLAYSPVALMMMCWLFYIHYVSRGYICTTKDHIQARVLDYTCSIYVFVIGDDGRRIERWAKYTGCYPTNFPFSQQILHNIVAEPDMLQKFSINWNFNRYEPMNPEVFTDFNFLSESEWLCKLKPAFWENSYVGTAYKERDMISTSFINNTNLNGMEEFTARSLNRPEALWDVIQPELRGMSGMTPPSLIESDYDGKVTNYWGGYPYIVNGTNLIWVTPEMSPKNGEVTRDIISGGKRMVAPDINANGYKSSADFNSKQGAKNMHNIKSKRSEQDIKNI